MSQHSQSTQVGPSRASIAAGWVLVAAVSSLMARLITDEVVTEAHLIGFGLGLGLNLMLVAQTVTRMGERGLAQDRIRRERERAERAEAAVRDERRRNTGTWEGDGPGQVLTVRWDADSRTYLVRGWLGDFWQAQGETPWPDLETLAAALTEFERAGELVAWHDEGTRSVRARLDLPGWDGTTDTVTVQEEPGEFVSVQEWQEADAARQGVGEQTQRLVPPPVVRGPVETLRPIDTAVFRTEVDRAAWATDPTETFPRQS